jgi:cell division septal protein FtsQ
VLVRAKSVLPADRTALRLQAAGGVLPALAVRFVPTRRGLALVAACLVAVPVGYWGARVGPFFEVRAIEVEGAPPALSRQVRAALRPIIGQSLLALDGGDVIGRVEALPQVAAASYDRSFPQTLVVRVRREVGRAVLRQGHGSWIVSARGRVIRPIPLGSHARLPRIWVGRSVAVRVGEVLSDPTALRSVRALASLRAEPLPVEVHAVDARTRLVFSLARGMELRLGDATDLPLKLAVAARVLEVMAPPQPEQHLFLDVSVPDRPVVGSTLKSEVEPED